MLVEFYYPCINLASFNKKVHEILQTFFCSLPPSLLPLIYFYWRKLLGIENITNYNFPVKTAALRDSLDLKFEVKQNHKQENKQLTVFKALNERTVNFIIIWER
jgi:hypothetical protein